MQNLIQIRKYSVCDYSIFKKMFTQYFTHDFNINLTDEQFQNICEHIEKQVLEKIQFVDLLILDGIVIGFINYQIDSPKSDWNFKETWGCIREVFIDLNFRKKGYATKLINHAETELRNLLVPGIYLTADSNFDFWIKMGYTNTGEVCAANNSNIFVSNAVLHNKN
ncbi:MAG: GNAT family N-acetyltransferase [Firmicutes bacterium]|nr:GNAT family N-acetyltransferase [Bacillota bacterium]MCL2177665.1 GNAT family N-acetyltransferase [Bacillota bacterium]